MERFFINLPDRDLAHFPTGTNHYAQYMRAVFWAQRFARTDRSESMSLRRQPRGEPFAVGWGRRPPRPS